MNKVLFALLLLISTNCRERDARNALPGSNDSNTRDASATVTTPLKSNSMYTVFISKDVEASRAFYTRWLNFKVVFASSWFILLSSAGEHPVQIAFMLEDHPSSPPSPKAFSGDGTFLTIEVRDASAQYESLKAAGATFSYHLKDEPWGQRRFAITDPNGIWIDVVQQTEPQEGWWDQYMKC